MPLLHYKIIIIISDKSFQEISRVTKTKVHRKMGQSVIKVAKKSIFVAQIC